jgi:class 3 adenylate cyclase
MKEGPPGEATADTRRLAAIMFTDIVGFSRQMGADEARMLRLLAVHNQVIEQAVAEYHGHVIKTVGDAFLVDFPSVVNAVQCAQRIQAQFRTHNTEKEPVEQIHVRIGIHSGDIVQRDGDVFGDGVNVASRLQALAEPDTTCISHYYLEWVWQWNQDPQSLERAFALEQQALALDGSLPVAHMVLGYVSLQKNHQHDLAIAEGERALTLDANCAVCYQWLATVQNYIGRPEEAIKLAEKALRLDPRTRVNPLMLLGWSYFLARRYEEAIATLKRAITLNPNFLVAHLSLAGVYGELGQEEGARAEAADVLRLSPKFSLEAWGQRLPYKDPAVLERSLAAWRKAGLK